MQMSFARPPSEPGHGPLPARWPVAARWGGGVALCTVLGWLMLTAAARSEGGSQIKIDNFTFSPTPATISKGTEVTWTNQDDIPHSIVLAAIGVHSKALDTGNSFTYRFDRAGTFSYTCGLHPNMHAQVVVK